ncbi:hypothetical protein [Chitinophaga defluvii]|uniref:Uncharacterized protein n=1 Tax=Chitinophaga defluvii TaxID=3163343 RepID=A0ABV2T2G2_9BACT
MSNPVFTGNEGHFIPVQEAAKHTKSYRLKKAAQKDAGPHAFAHFFGANVIQRLLKQPGCVGIRIYHATNEKGHRDLVIVGVTADGEDILQLTDSPDTKGGMMLPASPTSGGAAATGGNPCPNYCPKQSPLPTLP